MEFIEEEILNLAIILLRKAKIEKKLKQTFKCLLRKLFTCCGMKNLEEELKNLNHSLEMIQKNKVNKKKIKRYSSI